MNRDLIILRQRAFWNNWAYLISNRQGQSLGIITADKHAQAVNANLATVDPDQRRAASMTLHGQQYAIRYEYLSRSWNNDVAWWLEAADGQMLARIEKRFPKSPAGLPEHRLVAPDSARIFLKNTRSPKPFEAVLTGAAHTPTLRFSTPGWLQIRLEMHVSGDYANPPIRAFMGYYALSQR